MFGPGELAEATQGRLFNCEDQKISGFSIDSRTLDEGEFFIPLPGSSTDGHYFLDEAFRKGAIGAFVSSEDYLSDEFENLILVEDTEKALLQAAAAYRKNFEIPIIGVTGSWGKTTSKELLASILSRTGSVHRSPGNYNTEYGLPLALLEMPETTDYGVFELGLQYPDDVGKLSKVLSPTHGLITGVGKAHLEHFRGVEEIAREKLKLTEGMEEGSVLIINGDAGPLVEAAEKVGALCIKYGLRSSENAYSATKLEASNLAGLSFSLKKLPGPGKGCNPTNLRLESGLHSRANVYNVLAAASLALEMGVSAEAVKQGVKISPLPQRLETKPFPGGTVIDDTYNANPAATRNALAFLSGLNVEGDKFFVMGDMMELGRESATYHEDLAPYVRSAGVQRTLGLGKFTKQLVFELNKGGSSAGATAADWFREKSKLKNELASLIRDRGNAVLVKGSRDMKMEEIVQFLLEEYP